MERIVDEKRGDLPGSEGGLNQPPKCWCGNIDLLSFCREFARCPTCETLVFAQIPGPEIAQVTDDERAFYGRTYWFAHMERDLGLSNIVVRSRKDLPERCLYWLHTVLKYKLPPSRVLELGSGHGGFVALLRWAGFDATGLEVSPWVVEFARTKFNVPMLLGPVEDQQIAPGSLDVIALMDVFEHLADPAGTIRHCLGLLKPDGLLIIQTPRYPEGKTYEEMVTQRDGFLDHLKPIEHVYLFSQHSIREFFTRLGCQYVQFEPPIFPHYDMFLVVGRAPLAARSPEAMSAALRPIPTRRLVQAFLSVDRLARLPVVERHRGMSRILRRMERLTFRLLWNVVPSLPKGSRMTHRTLRQAR